MTNCSLARAAFSHEHAPIWTSGWPHNHPLHLTGNTTEEQNTQLLEFLGEAVTRAHSTVMEELDQTSAQAVLESSRKLKNEAVELLVELIHHHTTSERFKMSASTRTASTPPLIASVH